MNEEAIKELLDYKVDEYEKIFFIGNDPISIPHQFSNKHDIEIAGFFAAILAWGNRTTIINNCKRLMSLMGNSPFEFILHHEEKDLKPFLNFVHRTFNATDLLYCFHWMQKHYRKNESLEAAFISNNYNDEEQVIKNALINFHNNFFALPDAPERTRKHISTPAKKSACKRLNMYLRWMVRKNSEVDFGIWKNLEPKNLMMPLDIHSGNIARRLGLLYRKQNDWLAVMELTKRMKEYDTNDPAKYDFALFALGAEERWK